MESSHRSIHRKSSRTEEILEGLKLTGAILKHPPNIGIHKQLYMGWITNKVLLVAQKTIFNIL